jgi:crossover junction endodeoxyribonuclease RuvC
MNRFEVLVVLVKKVCERFDPSLIAVEGYSFNSKFGLPIDRMEYGGLLRYALSRKWAIMEVSPMSLKKWASGSGKGDKTGVIAGITSLYGMRFQSSDEYDAYALARIALQLKNGEIPANTPQREVIEKLWNPAVKKKKPLRDKPSRKRKPKGIA